MVQTQRKILLPILLILTCAIYAGIYFELQQNSKENNLQNDLDPLPPNWLTETALILDLGKPGIDLLPLVVDSGKQNPSFSSNTPQSNTFFDIDNDGFAELISWPAGSDGFLVLDKNENGQIDDHTELFGRSTEFKNGFIQLAKFDSNNDGAITASDPAYKKIQVWVDQNSNGMVNDGELKSLQTLGLEKISLNFERTQQEKNALNPVPFKGAGFINKELHSIEEVELLKNNILTIYKKDVTLNVAVLFLPTLKGFGNLPDLHVAMSENPNLLNKMTNFVNLYTTEYPKNSNELNKHVEGILFEWANCSSISKTSRGSYVDAQKLAFTEKFVGAPFSYQNPSPDPNPQNKIQGDLLEKAYKEIFFPLRTSLTFQTIRTNIFQSRPFYNLATGEMIADSPITTIGIRNLENLALSMPIDQRMEFWTNTINMIFHVRKKETITPQEVAMLNKSIETTTETSGINVLTLSPP